jgi:two-component system, sensor histidine kinase PdtaS
MRELLAMLPVPAEAEGFGNDPDAVAEVLIYLVGKKLIDVPSMLEVRLNLQWGTHACQIYRSREELLELVVPFFRQGLRDDEACAWIGREALRFPEVDQVSWHDPDDWRTEKDVWLQRALDQGYRGLRIAGDTRGLGAIRGRRIKALCTYPVEHCDPGDVLSRHDAAYVKRDDGWARIAASPTL